MSLTDQTAAQGCWQAFVWDDNIWRPERSVDFIEAGSVAEAARLWLQHLELEFGDRLLIQNVGSRDLWEFDIRSSGVYPRRREQ